jgi:hypothetical protein
LGKTGNGSGGVLYQVLLVTQVPWAPSDWETWLGSYHWILYWWIGLKYLVPLST